MAFYVVIIMFNYKLAYAHNVLMFCYCHLGEAVGERVGRRGRGVRKRVFRWNLLQSNLTLALQYQLYICITSLSLSISLSIYIDREIDR